jgi:hypothetical protein
MSATFKSTMSAIQSINPSQFANDAERFAVKEALRKLLVRIETPFERIWALSFENPPLIAGLRIGMDLGLWKKWAAIYQEKGEAELTLDQIVAQCDKRPEPNLLRKRLHGNSECKKVTANLS